MLHVSWNDHDLDQSPYTVIVLDPSTGSTSSISGMTMFCSTFFWGKRLILDHVRVHSDARVILIP